LWFFVFRNVIYLKFLINEMNVGCVRRACEEGGHSGFAWIPEWMRILMTLRNLESGIKDL